MGGECPYAGHRPGRARLAGNANEIRLTRAGDEHCDGPDRDDGGRTSVGLFRSVHTRGTEPTGRELRRSRRTWAREARAKTTRCRAARAGSTGTGVSAASHDDVGRRRRRGRAERGPRATGARRTTPPVPLTSRAGSRSMTGYEGGGGEPYHDGPPPGADWHH